MIFKKRILLLLILLFPALPQMAFANSVDPVQVRNILLAEGDLITPDNVIKGRIDKWASAETLKLDEKNPNWTPSNPNWPSIYGHIRSDIETSYPQLDLNGFQNKLFVETVASHISQTDADTVSAYYNSLSGKRYLDFFKAINTISITFKAPRKDVPLITDEQSAHYARILKLSRAYQMLKIQSDKSGFSSGDLPKTIQEKIHEEPADLENLYNKFYTDLPDFESFASTNASAHLFEAISLAYKNTIKSSELFATSAKQLAELRDQWKKLYSASNNK